VPVVYHVYADESGIQPSARYCVIAGYVGVPAEWEAFEQRWRSILADYEVDDVFHTKVFFGRDQEGKRLGPYREWTDAKALAFIAGLAHCIDARNILPVSSCFDVRAFNALTHRQRRWFTGAHITGKYPHFRFRTTGAPSKPYYAALMDFIVRTMRSVEPDASIHLRLDQQNVLEAWGHKVFGHLKEWGFHGDGLPALASIEYHSSKDRVELQAADLLAHCWYSYCMRAMSGLPMNDERWIAIRLLTRKDHQLAMFDADSIPSAFSTLTAEQRDYLEQGIKTEEKFAPIPHEFEALDNIAGSEPDEWHGDGRNLSTVVGD
jgi:hypothetical protein